MGRDGEADEFREFVAGSQAKMVRVGELLTGDRGRAEDLAQHGFAQAFAAWPRLRSGDPEAYVRRCMINAQTDWWRRRTWRELPTGQLPERADLTDLTAAAAERQVVLRALARLTVKGDAARAGAVYYLPPVVRCGQPVDSPPLPGGSRSGSRSPSPSAGPCLLSLELLATDADGHLWVVPGPGSSRTVDLLEPR